MERVSSKIKPVNTHGDTNVPSGMLSSPHLAYCVDKYKIIDNFKPSCLGPVTYNMRLGGTVLTWENGEKVEFELGEETDVNRNIHTKVELRPNSLTFVTTIEKFNLPKDIIARFNLKSKWVHEGLLLGTGPIVDPELQANLLIPLHNFSSQDITLHYGEEFISVEFTKTLNPDDVFKTISTEFKYVENENSKFDFHKYRKRIGGKKVESSVLYAFTEMDKTNKEYKVKLDQTIREYNSKLSVFTWVGVATFFSVFIGLVALVFTTWTLTTTSFVTYHDAANIVKQYKGQNIDFRAFALKSSSEDQRKGIAALKKQVDMLNNKNTASLPFIEKDIHILKKQIQELSYKISTIESAPHK